MSFGEALRREREVRRIPLREVSEATKINIRYLEALERNEFKYLPSGAFTRGFIRSYAQFIGADENRMLEAYSAEVGQQQERQKSTPEADQPRLLRDMLDAARENTRESRSWIVVLVVLFALLLAGAVGVPLWLHSRQAAPEAAPSSGSLVP